MISPLASIRMAMAALMLVRGAVQRSVREQVECVNVSWAQRPKVPVIKAWRSSARPAARRWRGPLL